MMASASFLVLSDIHYAGSIERHKGCPELAIIRNPLLRFCVRAYRHYFWKRDPFAHNHLVDEFLNQAPAADYVIANGDYSCDSAFVGVSDDACCQSVRECLAKLRQLGPRLRLVIGDHELGKLSLFGGRGGIRLSSWVRAQKELGMDPFWEVQLGNYRLLGVTSSLIAFPVLEPEALPEERAEWSKLREEHLGLIRASLSHAGGTERFILFCHDPTALPFLWQDEGIRAKLGQVEATIIGHLHSPLLLWKSRLLAGMPTIRFLGNSIRRMSSALHDARLWRHFNVKLCPALSGIELLKDGGYFRVVVDLEAKRPIQIELCRTNWSPGKKD